MARGRMVWAWLGAMCLVLGGIKAGKTAELSLVSGIETKAQYLNNINNSPKNRKSDCILSAGPDVAMNYKSEITRLEAKLALLGLAYMQNSGYNTINQYYYINGDHKLTTRLALNLGLRFVADSTAREELLESGTVITRDLRNSIAASPGFTYQLTERLSTSLGYNFNWVDYQSERYTGYTTHGLSQGFSYLLTEKATLQSMITARYSRYDSGNTISSLGPQVGFIQKFSENWDMNFLGGINLNRTKSNVGVQSFDDDLGFIRVLQKEQRSSTVSPFITLATNYRWQTGGLSLNYTRSESPNAYGNLSEYNNFNLSIKQGITDKLSYNITPYFYTSSISSPGSDYKSYYYGVRQGLSYKLTERTSVGANYRFAYRTVTGTSDYSYPINDVWVTLNYSYPIHYQY